MAEDADDIDNAAEDASSDWRTLMDPLTGPIAQLIDGADSLEAIRDGLAGLGDSMSVDGLTEQLARATFAGRLAGDSSVGRETEVRS